jgi:exodeoxyribonuclease VII small subunit
MSKQAEKLSLETLSFEEAFSELETTVQRLEEGALTLEEAIALYERGMSLAQRCNDALDAAELQVQQLTVAGECQEPENV